MSSQATDRCPGADEAAPFAVEVDSGVVLRGRARAVTGSGTPLLLLHGLASNARMWDGTARALAHLGHPTVALDLRGHGTADKPTAGYDFPTFVSDVRVALAALASAAPERWSEPVLVGQSLGGNLALEVAAAFPAAVSGIACVDGGMIDLRVRFPEWERCERELAPPDLSDRTRAELAAMIRAGSPDWPQEGIDGMLACFGDDGDHVTPHLTRDRHMALLRALWEHCASRLYPQVQVPVLLVPAEGGGTVAFTDDKRDDVRRALEALPRARAHWFSPADHDIHAQHPAELAEVLHAAIADGFLA